MLAKSRIERPLTRSSLKTDLCNQAPPLDVPYQFLKLRTVCVLAAGHPLSVYSLQLPPRLSTHICKIQSGFQWKCPFCPPGLSLHRLRSIRLSSYCRPFLKETKARTVSLYRQQPPQSTMASKTLCPGFPTPAACRHNLRNTHKDAVPAPYVCSLPGA